MQEQIDTLKKQVEDLTNNLKDLEKDYYQYNFPVLQVFKKDLSFEGKVGFFKATPVAQQSAITSPSGGGGSSSDAIDVSSRTAIGQIKTVLQNIGITV